MAELKSEVKAKAVNVRMSVHADLSKFSEIPTVYTNHIEVSGNPAEAFLIVCLREDPLVEIGDINPKEGEIVEIQVTARPLLNLMMSAGAARRFAEVLTEQLGTVANPKALTPIKVNKSAKVK